jgi:hypothetical protein
MDYDYLNAIRLFVIFGEHQVMAQLIAKRVLISPLINKDFGCLGATEQKTGLRKALDPKVLNHIPF